jgi:hypothetical protein
MSQQVGLNDLAAQMVEEADCDLTLKQAKEFIKKALSNTLNIVKNSRGRICFRHCDVVQLYKPIDYDKLKDQIKDLNETKTPRDGIWPYQV